MSSKYLGTAAALAAILFLALELRTVRDESESLRALAGTLDRQAAALMRSPTVPGIAAATSEAEPAPAGSRPAPPPGALASYSDRNVLGDPEHAAIVARRHRRYALANYRAAIDRLQLPLGDAVRLKELIAERWLAREDTNDVLDRMGDATPEIRSQARAVAQAEADQRVRDLLGPDGLAQLEAAYRDSSTERMNWALYTDFWDAGLPLTAAQKSALARALALAEPPGEREPDHAGLLQAAEVYLSPEQVAFLRERKLAETRARNAAGANRR